MSVDVCQVERFSSWDTVVPKVSTQKVPTSHSVVIIITEPHPDQRGHPRIGVNARCTKRALRKNNSSALIRLLYMSNIL